MACAVNDWSCFNQTLTNECTYVNSTDFFVMSIAWENTPCWQYLCYGSSLINAVMAFIIWMIPEL